MPEATTDTPPKKSLLGDIIKLIVFLGIGFFFIYWFLLKLDADQKQAVWSSFTNANYFWVATVMLCIMVAHFVRALRWRLLYKPLGYQPSLGNTFGAVVVTYMANLAFPRLGEVLRCALLRTSDNIPVQKSIGTVVTERCFDVLAFGVVVLVGLLFMYGQAREWLVGILQQKSHDLPSLATVAAILIVAVAVCVVIYRLLCKRLLRYSFFRKIDNTIQGGLDGLKSIFCLSPASMALFLLYSALIYLLYIAGGVLILQAFTETTSLGLGAAFVLYLFGSVGMTISQGGLGTYPALVMEALALYGISQAVGLAAGWLLWASQQAIVIVVGLAYLIYFSLAKKKSKSRITVQ